MENSEKQRKTRYFAHYTDQTAEKPKKKPNRTTDTIISIRATNAERDHLQALAAAAGLDMRSYIATTINAYARQTVIALAQGRGNRMPRKPATRSENGTEQD